jgi:hypothetical protein
VKQAKSIAQLPTSKSFENHGYMESASLAAANSVIDILLTVP